MRQIISIMQDEKGRLYNLVKIEDDYGIPTFICEYPPVDTSIEAKLLVDFTLAAGHKWIIKASSIYAIPCKSGCNICQNTHKLH